MSSLPRLAVVVINTPTTRQGRNQGGTNRSHGSPQHAEIFLRPVISYAKIYVSHSMPISETQKCMYAAHRRSPWEPFDYSSHCLSHELAWCKCFSSPSSLSPLSLVSNIRSPQTTKPTEPCMRLFLLRFAADIQDEIYFTSVSCFAIVICGRWVSKRSVQ